MGTSYEAYNFANKFDFEAHVHLTWARELKEKFPEETKDVNLVEIRYAWAAFSWSLAAQWLIPEGYQRDVQIVMDRYRTWRAAGFPKNVEF
jgi:hypothetical protein